MRRHRALDEPGSSEKEDRIGIAARGAAAVGNSVLTSRSRPGIP